MLYNITLRCVRAIVVAVGAIGITYSQCVFVALGIQHAVHIYHIVICGMSGSTIFFLIISQAALFWGGDPENKMCVLIFSTTFICNISHIQKN